jgi:Cu(I)/Ag(I) efflux system membrane fusion protein
MTPWLTRGRITLAVLLAAIVGYWVGRHPASPSVVSTGRSPAPATSGPVLYWYDPMVPDQHFDKPGLSPMGMEMVPKHATPADTVGSVRIEAATLQNLGVRVVPVQRQTLTGELEAPGAVTWDLRRAVTVSARTDAVIARLHVRAPYTTVAQGAPLADVWAPAWNSALAEAEALRQTQSPDTQALRGAAQQRLRVLGLTPNDLRGARPTDGSFTLHAPQAGVVTSLDVREGQRVVAGQTLMTLNDPSQAWVEAALPQGLAGRVRAGTPVVVRSDAWPGQSLSGTVEALLPDLDPTTRTQRARIALANSEGRLSPGQFVRVAFTPEASTPTLTVPTEALMVSGDRPRVIVTLGEGRFRAMVVTTGRSAGGNTEITAGLRGDEQVVVSGQFLIDSEASLSGALERLEAPAAAQASSTAMPQAGAR